MKLKQFQADLTAGKYDEKLCKLYGSSDAVLAAQRARYLQAAENFSRLYPERDEIAVFSAPGRTEIGGNHTDHQHGCVLAAAVNLDALAAVSENNTTLLRVQSEGYPMYQVELSLDNLTTEGISLTGGFNTK
ncbi:galactokinase family protein, partial [uncultured Ruminococcus sp.]|uniref:galactokinase family protein n=1 Tax=uncultured Ruminococcus sp. TaxID=165186 RepID=UPI002587A52E